VQAEKGYANPNGDGEDNASVTQSAVSFTDPDSLCTDNDCNLPPIGPGACAGPHACPAGDWRPRSERVC
jgi:hypothetical protein